MLRLRYRDCPVSSPPGSLLLRRSSLLASVRSLAPPSVEPSSTSSLMVGCTGMHHAKAAAWVERTCVRASERACGRSHRTCCCTHLQRHSLALVLVLLAPDSPQEAGRDVFALAWLGCIGRLATAELVHAASMRLPRAGHTCKPVGLLLLPLGCVRPLDGRNTCGLALMHRRQLLLGAMQRMGKRRCFAHVWQRWALLLAARVAA